MITLTLPLPPSSNSMYRNVPRRGRVKTKAYKTWIKTAWHGVLWQKRVARVSGPYQVSIKVPEQMRGDADNGIKPLLDFMVSYGITDDDRYCRKTSIERAEVPKGMCEVTVKGMGLMSRKMEGGDEPK